MRASPKAMVRPRRRSRPSATMSPSPAAARKLTLRSSVVCPTPPAAFSWVVPRAPPTAMSTSAPSTPPCTGAPAEFLSPSVTGTRRRTQPSPASSTWTPRWHQKRLAWARSRARVSRSEGMEAYLYPKLARDSNARRDGGRLLSWPERRSGSSITRGRYGDQDRHHRGGGHRLDRWRHADEGRPRRHAHGAGAGPRRGDEKDGPPALGHLR